MKNRARPTVAGLGEFPRSEAWVALLRCLPQVLTDSHFERRLRKVEDRRSYNFRNRARYKLADEIGQRYPPVGPSRLRAWETPSGRHPLKRLFPFVPSGAPRKGGERDER